MNRLLASIAPAEALGIELSGWNGICIELAAPLDRNLNDKGTAFAGSIDSMLDLAGWGALTLALRDAGFGAEVMIVESTTEYTAAARADMIATAAVSSDEIARITEELVMNGKSRTRLRCRLSANGVECAAMEAQYAIIMKPTPGKKSTE